MYVIRFSGKGGCQRAGFIEALLKYMGAKRRWNPRDDLRIIFDSQEEFKSSIFCVDYELPPAKTFLFFSRRIFLTFKYDKIDDVAEIQFDGANKQVVQSIVNNLSLMQQATPNELQEKVGKFAELAKAADPTQPIEILEVDKHASKSK
uniref:Uncharacterized protein n=1 Tax=viral metagenome TaxID=1070528 RepID=A0A6M3L715_9ZZZZ